MKCLVIGHTKNIGKAIYDRLLLLGHEVVGISRSTGHDVEKDSNNIIALAQDFDLVVNNAYHNNFQSRVVTELSGKVKIITIGSIAGYYSSIATRKKDYCLNKKELIVLATQITSGTNLLLNVGLAENASPDPGCTFNDIANMCELWIRNPIFTIVNFKIDLTETNRRLIEADFGISAEQLLIHSW